MTNLQGFRQGSKVSLGSAGSFPEFEAVGNRCAFVTGSIRGKPDRERLATALTKAGLGVHEIDPVNELGALIARPWMAELYLKPLTSERAAQWAYGRKGVRIPRTTLGQFECGDPVSWREAARGDLLFARIRKTIQLLGLATGSGSVLGVARNGAGITERDYSDVGPHIGLLARRPISGAFNVVTVITGSASEIFRSSDIDRLLAFIDR